MSFEWPLFLLALLLVPLALVAYLLLERRRARYTVTFTNLDVLAGVARRSRPWRRYVPAAVFLLALAAALAALARPHVEVSVTKEDATVVLTLDNSGSMFADDVPPTRLAAAQEAVRRFLDRLPDKYRVGMVAFSSEAQVVAPLTTNRDLVREALDFLLPGRGTALGDALGRSVELALDRGPAAADAPAPAPVTGDDDRPLRAILLLSDGYQTRGVLQPLEGAERAKAAGIPVYTVALGTPEGVVRFGGGGFERVIPVPPDPETLRQISQATGGEFFAAPSAARLNSVYERLGSKLGRTREPREATFVLLGVSALLLIASGLLSWRWLQRLP